MTLKLTPLQRIAYIRRNSLRRARKSIAAETPERARLRRIRQRYATLKYQALHEEERRFERKRKRWIVSELVRMAHDDGTYESLAAEYEQASQRSL